jgi:hypothetical protein
VEHFILINQTIDITMGNRTSILDDSSVPTDVPEMIKTTVASSIVLKEKKTKSKRMKKKTRRKSLWKVLGTLIPDLFRSDNAKIASHLTTEKALTAVTLVSTPTPTEGPEMIEKTVAASTQDLPHTYAILAGSDADTVGHVVLVHSKEEEEKESLEGVGKMIQDLFRSDNAKVNAALDALKLDFDEDKTKCESFVTAGGCFVLVQLLKKCLDKAIDRIPACDQVTELNELAELTTLSKTLSGIVRLTFRHKESSVGIAAIGGAEAVVKIMKTFPNCQMLQEDACGALLNLTCYNTTGKKEAIESGGIEVVLVAINNHLGSSFLCERACKALFNIANGSKENTGLLITLGGGAGVAKLRTKWSNDDNLKTKVRRLADLIAAEMKAWADEE